MTLFKVFTEVISYYCRSRHLLVKAYSLVVDFYVSVLVIAPHYLLIINVTMKHSATPKGTGKYPPLPSKSDPFYRLSFKMYDSPQLK